MCSYGLVVISRLGSKSEKFIFESDMLSKHSVGSRICIYFFLKNGI